MARLNYSRPTLDRGFQAEPKHGRGKSSKGYGDVLFTATANIEIQQEIEQVALSQAVLGISFLSLS